MPSPQVSPLSKLSQLFKLDSSSLSTLLGIGVVVVIGSLIVNYFRTSIPIAETESEPPITELTGKESPEEAKTIVEKSQQPITYTVKPGDHLWKIAENVYQSGYAWPEIAKANQITHPDTIEIGQELTIPKIEKAYPQTTREKIAGTSIQPIEGGTYTVTKGDTLWDIAVRAYADGYRWPEIAKANHLVNPHIIHSGNTFTIPRP